MNKKLLIIITIIVVVVGIGATILIVTTNKPKNDTSTQQSAGSGTDNTSTNETTETKIEGNLASMTEGGKALVCDMDYTGENGASKGKMYTDGKGRGRITMDIETTRGNSGQSNTLVHSKKVYTWTKTDSGTFGMVMDINALSSGGSNSPSGSDSQSANKNFNMSCKKWAIDESILTVPTDVNFTSPPVTP